uniref:Uncharacterized protein n=1 Tax=Utricularia reniformis TaxID=192314 RepID=A0A1Y0B2M8_9LAMI|nr:hypothetical protein AEK19_MT1460 [Utricularia reniformis]ART31651.1 hypothetical protein AEK19_MT1460 [Utricularia reniformis]
MSSTTKVPFVFLLVAWLIGMGRCLSGIVDKQDLASLFSFQ